MVNERTKKRSSLLLGLVALGAASCSGSGGGEGGYEVAYHAQLEALPGFDYDTGFQPAMSPVQVQALLTGAGGETIDARAHGTGSGSSAMLTGEGGTGNFAMDAHFQIAVNLKIEATGVHYEGPIMGAPNIDVAFGGQSAFDPFLVGGSTSITADVPETMVATIPLAGAVPVPGLQGNLILRVRGTLHSVFAGVCAATADGDGEYRGTVTTDGMLVVKPSVQIDVFTFHKTLEPYDVPVPIPAFTTQVLLNPHHFAAGEDGGVRPTVDGGTGTMATAGTCGGADGGMDGGAVDGGGEMDGAIAEGGGDDATSVDDVTNVDDVNGDTDARATEAGTDPGPLFALCDSDGACLSGMCLQAYPGGLCSQACSVDRDCNGGIGAHCVSNVCVPSCTDPSMAQCRTYQATCIPADSTGSSFVCYPSCIVQPRTGGDIPCGAGVTCDPYVGVCTTSPSTGADNGEPCASDSDCRSGTCIMEVTSGSPTGFLGGYCYSYAMSLSPMNNRLQQSNCPSGSLVLPEGGADGSAAPCLHACSSDAECRNGYICDDLSRPDDSTSGYSTGLANRVCLPVNCSDPRYMNACPVGTHCVDMSTPGSRATLFGVCVTG